MLFTLLTLAALWFWLINSKEVAKLGEAHDRINIWFTIDHATVHRHQLLRSVVALKMQALTRGEVALTAGSCSPFLRSGVRLPRLPARSLCVRAAQHKGEQGAQQPPHHHDLKLDATRLTGIAGLLTPLVLAHPALAATPDGEHLTKVRGSRSRRSLQIYFCFFYPCLSINTGFRHMQQGTLVSLIHPALMDFLLLSTLWTGYLGWQWRRTRTIPEELKELKSQLPPKDAEGNRPTSKLDGRIAALEEVCCPKLCYVPSSP